MASSAATSQSSTRSSCGGSRAAHGALSEPKPKTCAPARRPPELILGAVQYGPEVDMWSVGCIMAELLLQRPLFAGGTEMEQITLISKSLGTPTEDNMPGTFSKLQ